MLLFAFAPDDKLYFMAEEVDAAAFAVQNLVEKLWKPRYGAIVPWSQIDVLSNMPLGDQVDFLRSKFDLEGVEATPDESPNSHHERYRSSSRWCWLNSATFWTWPDAKALDRLQAGLR